MTDIILLLLLTGIIAVLFRSFTNTKDTLQTEQLDRRFDEYLRKINGLDEQLKKLQLEQLEASSRLREQIGITLAENNTQFEKRQNDALKQLAEMLQSGMTETQKQVGEALLKSSEELGKRVEELTKKTEFKLGEISGQVEKRLSDGFEKTNATFTDILKRLVLIDEAQKKITELSTNVVSLQELLADKRSRGAFGEVQLASLVANVLPEANYQLQYTLPNDKIVDCILFLPEPTGMLAIDAKFPLESYRLMTDLDAAESDRKRASSQFKADIQKHIKDIASKYILPDTTSDGAMMFIPAEAIFAEIQAHHPDLVERGHQAKVWMVSPTTLWAILNTARSVLKDAATREQVHLIQEHLRVLSDDFGRFRKRMDNLAKHINQANKDVEEVNKSANKISSRFDKIERVELEHEHIDSVAALEVDDKEKIT